LKKSSSFSSKPSPRFEFSYLRFSSSVICASSC